LRKIRIRTERGYQEGNERALRRVQNFNPIEERRGMT